MTEPTIPDWISAISSAASALFVLGTLIAAIFAALYAKRATQQTQRAANAAANSAKSAEEQIELQRPLPLIIVQWQWDPNLPKGQVQSKAFALRNIGNSPAFDVRISDLQFTGSIWILETDVAHYITPNGIFNCHHKLSGADQSAPALTMIDPLPYFVRGARGILSSGKSLAADSPFHATISFGLSYSAADGRKLNCECALRFNLVRGTTWVGPMSSWLPPKS